MANRLQRDESSSFCQDNLLLSIYRQILARDASKYAFYLHYSVYGGDKNINKCQ